MSVANVVRMMRAAELIRKQSDAETDNNLLVAMAMQLGYSMGKMDAKQETDKQHQQ